MRFSNWMKAWHQLIGMEYISVQTNTQIYYGKTTFRTGAHGKVD